MMGLIRKLTSTISLHMSTLAFSKQITSIPLTPEGLKSLYTD